MTRNLDSQSHSTSRHLECKDLRDYLKTLSPLTLDRLYDHPATCLSVFRELPELSRLYIMRLLFVEQPIPQAVVNAWAQPNIIKEHTQNTHILEELNLFKEAVVPGGIPGWILNDVFRKNAKSALTGGEGGWKISSNDNADPHARDVEFLDKYAMERWECILHYMVGSSQQEGISKDAVRVLLHSGLMKTDDEDGSPVITTHGFQFLLMDTASQVWFFLLQYLDTCDDRNLDVVSCLHFLLQLSFSQLGKDYSTSGMGEQLLLFLQHLREFGLVYQRKRSSGRFYSTRLVLDLGSGQCRGEGDLHRPGYLIVETNYRICAYTNSDLQVALISLFSQLVYRFPNLTVAVLDRDNVRQALRSGITADQIISFLRIHAHPQMLLNPAKPVLPPTIVDQIKLWEMERDRFTFTDGVLYNQFLSQADYELLRNYSQDRGVLVWKNDQTRVMIVSKAGHDPVKKYWKRQARPDS